MRHALRTGMFVWGAIAVVACSGASTSDFTDGGVADDASGDDARARDGAPSDSGPSDGGHRLPDGAVICSVDGDCNGSGGPFLTCSPGGRVTGCGICYSPPNPCTVDSDCLTLDGAVPPKPLVCEPGGPCVCPVGGKRGSCVAACQNANDCGPNLACTGGHCVAKPCTTSGDCTNVSTGDYACSATGVCAPKPCASDGDCGGGHFCVDKICYPQAGMCTPPAA